MVSMGKSSRDKITTVLVSLSPGKRNHTLNVGLFSLKISQNNYPLMKSVYQMASFILFLFQKKQKGSIVSIKGTKSDTIVERLLKIDRRFGL